MPLRSLTYIIFVAMLGLSLICSVAIQAGHADVPIAASAELIRPLAPGAQAPRFVVETVGGEEFYFDPQNLDRPVVLLSYRGGWCPFCNVYLEQMRHAIPELRQLGVEVLFLSGDRSELLFASLQHETQEEINGLDYTILSDANAHAAIALGIAFAVPQRVINKRHENQQDIDGSSMLMHAVLSVPAVFVIDKHGEIRFSYTNADYKVRLPADELLAAVREIAAAD